MNRKKKEDAFMKRLQEETIFFMNHHGNIVIKSVPTLGYFVKFKGEKEVFVQKNNSIVTEIISDCRQITEEGYNKF